MIPTHLLESELVGKSTFNVLVLAGGVQVVGAHLGKHKGRAGKALMFQLHKAPGPAQAGAAPGNPSSAPGISSAMEYVYGNAFHSALKRS